ncbi:hypothetical protein CHUAL_007867 [Chamberlinius hualienensis]
MSRRKSFEHIAFHTFGSTGKLFAELNIIGFMLGLLISFFVVFGDLGATIISEIFGLKNSEMLRTLTLIVLGFGIALPLAMLKEIDVISKISTLSVIFYVILGVKIILEALPVLLEGHWKTQVTLWEPSGVLQCLPIFALALSCQTQIFTVCDSLPDPSLKTMNSIVKLAVYLCTGLYMIVGLFGYIGGCDKDISGNILVSLSSGFSTEIIKLGFVLSVAMSFPLVVLPCRSSIYSLLFKKTTGPFDFGANLMPALGFKTITFVIILSTFIIGLLCPNIEIVLGFVGSTIGVLICIIFPAMMFIKLTPKNTFEKRGSQVVLAIGVVLLVTCTWIRLQTVNSHTPLEEAIDIHEENIPNENVPLENKIEKEIVVSIPVAKSEIPAKEPPNIKTPSEISPVKNLNVDAEIKRQEPPVPESPDVKEDVPKAQESELNVEAIRKEDKELNNANKDTEVLQQLENDEKKVVLEQVEIIKKLEAHQEVEKKLLEEHRQFLADIISYKKVHENAVETDGKDVVKENSDKVNVEQGKDDKRDILEKKVIDEKQFLAKEKDIKMDGSQKPAINANQADAHNELDNLVNNKGGGDNVVQFINQVIKTRPVTNSPKLDNISAVAANEQQHNIMSSADKQVINDEDFNRKSNVTNKSEKLLSDQKVLVGNQREVRNVGDSLR